MTKITAEYETLINLYATTEANKEEIGLASDNNKAIGDQILAIYRELLEKHDQVPAVVHQNMCELNGWSHHRVDPITLEISKVDGNDAPQTHKSYSSAIKKYHAAKLNLNVDTMSEIRKAIKNPIDQAAALIKKYRKLSDTDKLRFEAALMQEAKTVGQIDLHKNKKAA
tara:strand:+ start:435 stop:941 length:507 start_codon:yes stop_codon:yes gene_type:complete